MPRYNVKNNKGEWACFSSISDSFITPFMPKDEYEKWRIKEYNYTEKDYEPAEKCNIMPYEEAMQTVLCNKLWDTDERYDFLQAMPEGDSKCDYCEYWDSVNSKCTIVEHYDKENNSI